MTLSSISYPSVSSAERPTAHSQPFKSIDLYGDQAAQFTSEPDAEYTVTVVGVDDGDFNVSILAYPPDGTFDADYHQGVTSTGSRETFTFTDPSSNVRPACDVGGPYEGEVGQDIIFDGTGSSDVEGSIISFEWDFGDGASVTGETPVHKYAESGLFDVTLCVTDDRGSESCCAATVLVSGQGGRSCEDYGQYAHWAATLRPARLTSRGRAVALSGDVAYVAGDSAFFTVDISDPEHPWLLGLVASPPTESGFMRFVDVKVDGTYAYVATNVNNYQAGTEAQGLTVIDVTNPAMPVIVGELVTPCGEGTSVIVDGSYLYLADGATLYGVRESAAVHLIDVSNPSSPQIVSSIVEHGFRLRAVGDLLYVASMDRGLAIVDISNPSDPQVLGELPMRAIDVDVSGAYAYVLDWPVFGNAVLHVVDVSEPASPQVVSSLPNPNGQRITVRNDRLYFADESYGLFEYDISDRLNPIKLSRIGGAKQSTAVVLEGGYAFGTDIVAGFTTTDISGVGSARPISSTGVSGSIPSAMIVDGDHLYALSSKLDILSIESPSNVILEGSVATTYGSNILRVSNGYSYVLQWGSPIQIIDVQIPSAPTIVGEIGVQGLDFEHDIRIQGNYAYVGSIGYGDDFHVFDISAPASPVRVGGLRLSHTTYGGVFELVVSGDKVLADVGDGTGLAVIDVSDPLNPAEVAWLPFEYYPDGVRRTSSGNIIIAGGYLYVLNNLPPWPEEPHFLAFDWANPLAPTLQGRVSLPGGYPFTSMSAANGSVYLTSNFDGFHVVDVSSPNAFAYVGGETAETFVTSPYTGVVAEGYFYLAHSGDGLGTYAISTYLAQCRDIEANSPPVCDAGGPYEISASLEVIFDGTGSSDVDGSIISYEWDFGDGTTGTGPNPAYMYADMTYYDVTLCVTDDEGARTCCETSVDYGNVKISDPNSQGDTPRITDVRLLPPDPNPFNPRVTVSFELPRRSAVRLRVYDLVGRLVRILSAEEFGPGIHSVVWDGLDDGGRPVSSGVYLASLSADGRSEFQKMVLIK